MDHSPTIEHAFFGAEDDEPQEDASDEEEVLVSGLQLQDSDNEINDGDFEFDRNAHERIVVGYNANLDVEEANEGFAELGLDVDKDYYPSSEELNTDCSSSEENNNRYPAFDPERELFDPQFEVGKTFKDMSEFRKAVRNHGVVTRHNLKMKPDEENTAQAVCKKDCKWRI